VKRVPTTIGFVTGYAAFYQIAPYWGVSTSAIMVLFLISPFLICYMAYVILKHGVPSAHTFEEKFYDDLD